VQSRGARPFLSAKTAGFEETMMSNGNSDKPSVDRLATGIRVATVVVVLGTLVAVWHPGVHGPASIGDSGSAASAPASTSDTAGSTDTTYFPSRFPAPENFEPEAPTF
jgi:hypothetical protein